MEPDIEAEYQGATLKISLQRFFGLFSFNKTLSIVPLNREMRYCNAGVTNDPEKKLTQLHGEFIVTNTDKKLRPVAVVKGEILKPYCEFKILTWPPGGTKVDINPSIPPGHRREIAFDAFFEPRIEGNGKSIKLKIILVDQYGNKFKHKCKFQFLDSGLK